ncbi:MAG: T9SS type A sorting domain-containing protein [Saprospiraceae bacterium]|nr:T9SS type A sorting domain-containing protein [Saprospiraceae bacterium]
MKNFPRYIPEYKSPPAYTNLIVFSRYNYSQSPTSALLAGGDAVFWARAAYALEDPAQTFNDSLLCTQSQSISRRPRQVPDSATFEVYPNPAADFVIIHTQQVADETGITIKLHDLLGNEQLKLTFTSGKQLHKLTPQVFNRGCT